MESDSTFLKKLLPCCIFQLCTLLLLCPKTLNAALTCVQETNCRCTLSDNSYFYDLTPMLGDVPAPYFKIFVEAQHFIETTFYYDPCRNFSKPASNSDCQGVSVCKEEPTYTYTNIGSFDTAEFLYIEDNDPPLRINYYNGKTGADQKNTTVRLVCGSSTSITNLVYKSNTPSYYLFELHSYYACKRAVPSSDLTAGGILCIIFVVLVAVYFGGGFIYLFFFKYESGTKAIPHYAFWSSLPGLIRDGFLYLCSCICNCGDGNKMTSSAPTYDAI